MLILTFIGLSVLYIINVKKYLLLIKYSNIFYAVISIVILSAFVRMGISRYQIVHCWIIFLSGTALIFLWLFNKRLISILLFSLGSLSNSLVMIANDGRMPVSRAAIEHHFKSENTQNELSQSHKLSDHSTRLHILSDVFYFNGAGGIFSLGDMCLLLFLMLAITEVYLFRSG